MKSKENEKPRTAEDVVRAYAVRMEELEVENEVLKEENETLSARLEEFRGAGDEKPRRGEAVICRGQEHDLYPGEVREIVLDVLRRAAEESRQGSRRGDVLRDIVAQNGFQDEPRRRAQGIKTAVKSYSGMTSAVKKKLHDLGIDPDPKVSKHIKVTYYGDQRYTAAMTSSGSDSRCGGKNLASDLIQRFL